MDVFLHEVSHLYHIAHCLSAILMWGVCVPVHLCIAYHIQCLHHQFQPLSQLLCLQLLSASQIFGFNLENKGNIPQSIFRGQALFGTSKICYNPGKWWPAHMLYYCKVPHSTSTNTHRKTKWSATAICLSFARMYLSDWAEHIMLTINASHVQQQFHSSWNKHTKKWGYLLVVADMSYDGKLCLAIIQVPQLTEMHCVHMIVSGELQRENISLIQELHCNTARW